MGATHLRLYQQMPQVRLAAVCDVSGRIRDGALGGVAGNIQQTGKLRLPAGTKVVSRFEALLKDPDIEVIDLCTPTHLHATQAIAALEAGKHVICEKPLAQTSAEARLVARAAARSRRLLMPAMCMRFWPGWGWLKEALLKKTYGKPLAASFRRVSARPAWGNAASHPGGALLDLHIHDTDFVLFLFGRPEKVFSTGVCHSTGAIDHVATQYLYANGPVVQAEGSWLECGGFNMGYTIFCEEATLAFDFQRDPKTAWARCAGRKPKAIQGRAADGYEAELRHFIDCVARGKSSGIVTAEDAAAALEICEAEQKSVRTGKVIALKNH